jgi:hypothetical protein
VLNIYPAEILGGLHARFIKDWVNAKVLWGSPAYFSPSVAKNHGGRDNTTYKTWSVPRWAANTVRAQLKEKAANYQISMSS